MSSSDSDNDEAMRELLSECVDRQFSAVPSSTGQLTHPTNQKTHRNALKPQTLHSTINKPSKRPQYADKIDNGDDIPEGMKTYLAKQLDQLISQTYQFVDTDISETPGREILVAPEVDHCVSFYNITSGQVNDKQNNATSPLDPVESCSKKRKPGKVHSKLAYTEFDEEELRKIAVSGEWVLNKRGVYGNGGERRSELVTGAVHSPALKKYK